MIRDPEKEDITLYEAIRSLSDAEILELQEPLSRILAQSEEPSIIAATIQVLKRSGNQEHLRSGLIRKHQRMIRFRTSAAR